jgi:hypothetical protein
MNMSACFRATNEPAAGKAGIASLFAIGYLCPGLPEPNRWASRDL